MKQFVPAITTTKTGTGNWTHTAKIFLMGCLFSSLFLQSMAQVTQSRSLRKDGGVDISVVLANPAANLDQGKNEAYTTPLTPMEWVNGNLNSNQAHYVEGHSVAYRLIMTDMPVGTEVTLTMGFDLVNGSKYAIDFLTGYQQLAPHNFISHGTEETVIPAAGASTSSMDITLPSYLAPANDGIEGVANARNAFNALPADDKKMYLWGASFNLPYGVTYVYKDGGVINEVQVLELTRGETKVEWTIKFTPSTSTVTLAWGGHIARRQDWGVSPIRSAGGINGSPYHMRTIDWSIGNLGNQDRSLQIALAAPICPEQFPVPLSLCYNPAANQNYPAGQCPSICAGGTLNFRVPDPSSPPGNSTYAWSVSPSTGVTINPVAANTQQVAITFANAGSYTVTVVINNNSGMTTTCTQVVTVNPSACSFTGANNVCPNSQNQYSGPAGSSWSWSITGNGTISGSSTSQNVTVVAGTTCGSYTLSLTVISNGCTATCSQTFSVTDTQNPVITFCPPGSALGCNPTSFPEPGTPTATDNCGPVTFSSVLGDPVNTGGCNWSRTRTYTATDACGNTATCTQVFTYSIATTPVFANCGQTYNLGCNPATTPTCANYTTIQTAGAVTASNECGAVTVSCSAGTVVVDGCNRSQVLTFTATSCGLTATCTRTYNWTVVTAPVFANCGQTYNLGCNPATTPTCANYTTIQTAGAVTASNECGPVTVSCSAGTVAVDGCNRSQVLTFTATACGLTSTCTRTYNWTVVTAPVFANCGQTYNLGCNPATTPTCANYTTIQTAGAVTASNECGPVTVSCSAGTVVVDGCNRSQVLTFTATSCGLTSTCTRTYNWTVVTAPVFANCGQTYNLGCNPTTTPTCANYTTIQTAGAVTASNECGPVTVTCSAGTVQVTGCNRSQVLTFTATSCGLTSTCTRTYNWTVVTAPVFANCGQTYNLGCNPTVTPTCENYTTIQTAGAVTASNECGPVTVTCSAGTVQSTGCNRSQVLTFTATACGLTTTCTRTYNWTVVTAPVFANCGQTYNLGCNPSVTPTCANYTTIQTAGAVTASNECGPVTVTCSAGTVAIDGCNRSQVLTFTATACGLTTTCTRTYNWTVVTAPVFANCGQTYNLGCNPSVTPTCANYTTIQTAGAVTASNECGPVTVTCSAGTVAVDGCNRSQVLTFTATACGLTTTCTRTYNWTVVTAPVFANCGQTYNLGCNPSVTPTCANYTTIQTAGAVTASNECGPVTVTCSAGTVAIDGCNRSQVLTFTATACGLTTTCTRTYNWTVVTAPVFANCGQTYNLGCNPTTIPTCANYTTIQTAGAVTASNECGPVTVTCSAGTVQSTGCNRSLVLTFTATSCGLTSTCTRTYNWTVVTAPVFANCGQTYNLGCNPTVTPTCENYTTIQTAGAVTASNECGPVTVTCSAGTVQVTGCNRTQVLTFTATSCGLTSTCTRTYNWTVVTAPVFANCGQTYNLGCNPAVTPTCENYTTIQTAGAVTASNECGPVTVTCSAGTVQVTGCNRSQVLTFTATACGLTTTCTRTYNWTVVTAPVFANCGQTYNLGCNPAVTPTCENYTTIQTAGAVTASNECGPVTVTCSAGTVQVTGCNRSQVLTFTATACGLTTTCTRTYNWTVVTAPVFANCGQTYNLGCNPAVTPTCENYTTIQTAGAVTASNECGPVTVTCSAGTVQVTGCNRSQVLTFTATSCGLTSTCTRTYNWTVVTAPVFANCGQTYNLGCNPTTTPTCANYTTIQAAGAVTASNECGPVTVTCSAGTVQVTGCNRSQVLTFTATACGLTTTCTRTYNWTVVTAPVFANCGQTYNLGCNPSVTPTCENYTTIQTAGAVTASNECGPVTVTCSAGTVQVTGCNRSQVLTFTATACGLTSTCTRTYNWTVVTAPVFANCGQTYNLGCNPTTTPTCANYTTIQDAGAVTASNECGPVTVTCSAGTVQVTGCNRSQVLTFTATACGLTSTCTRTYNWTVVTAPVFANCGQTYNLGCNPTTTPTCANYTTIQAAGAVTASNECGPVTVTCSAGTVVIDGCNRSQVLTFTATACGLTSTCTRTYNWTVVTAPVFANCGQTYNLGCNPTTTPTCANYTTIQAAGAVTASNECGPVTVTCSAGTVQVTGCNRSQVLTFTATACGLTSTCTRTYNWTVVTAPVFANCGQTYNLGCNPTTTPTCENYTTIQAAGAVTASNECGPVTVTCSAGTVQVTGCNRSQVLTFTATACGLTSTCTRTYNWTVVTAPVFANCGQTYQLGCNPTTTPTCANYATIQAAGAVTASNECGPVTVTCSAGTVQVTGCNRSQVLTFTATACGLTSTCTRTYNWTVVTAPVFANCGQTYNLGCNPTTTPTCANYTTIQAAGAVTASNECGPVTVTCSAGTVQVTGCNRTQVLTFTATACGLTSTCTRTYNWTVVTAPVFANCGQTYNLGCNPTTLPTCANYASIQGAGAVTASNECGPVTVTCSAGTVQENGCDRTQVLTFSATACGLTSTCTRTYNWRIDVLGPTITNQPPTTITAACGTTFPNLPWVPPVWADNCTGTITVTFTTTPNTQQEICPAVYVRVWTAVDQCLNQSTFTQTITVPCCTVCTYTQGAYGNYGGNGCVFPGPVVMSQNQIMINALTSEPGNYKVFGRVDLNRYWYIRLTDVNGGASSNIFKMLPGGTSSKVFLPDTYTGVPEYSNAPSWPVAPLKENNPQKGKILNQLFSQTLTLYFNLKNNSNLGGMVMGDSLITADANCGSNVPIAGTEDTLGMPHDVAAYLAGPNGYANTVGGLFQLANDMLGGVNTGLDLDEVQSAVEKINSGFDNCRILLGYVPYTASGRMIVKLPGNTDQPQVITAPKVEPVATDQNGRISVYTYPNPFNDKVRFVIQSPVSGIGVLEVYNMNGAKIQVVYNGYIYSGKGQTIDYNVPNPYRINMFYVLRVGDQVVTGKLINGK